MRRRQPLPAPEPEIDEYAEVKIPFDDVLRKLTSAPHAVKKPAAKKPKPPKS
jgi:hypothetical protein